MMPPRHAHAQAADAPKPRPSLGPVISAPVRGLDAAAGIVRAGRTGTGPNGLAVTRCPTPNFSLSDFVRPPFPLPYEA